MLPPFFIARRHMPYMFWSPDGEPRIFENAADAPADYTPYHPNDPERSKTVEQKPVAKLAGSSLGEAAKPPTQLVTPLARNAIMAALRRGAIPFRKADTTEALYALLHEKLREHLTAAGVEFAPDADAKTLLGLLPG